MHINFVLSVVIFVAGCQLVICQDEPGAIWMPSPHYTKSRSGGASVKYLIIHSTAGCTSGAQCVGNYFQKASTKASTHYVVDKKGVVVQCVRERDTAWSNGRKERGADSWWTPSTNYQSISIEHVKAPGNKEDLTAAQKRASFNLIKNIIRRHPGIKPRWADASGGITGHFSIRPISKKNCPGPYPWSELFNELGGSVSSSSSSSEESHSTSSTCEGQVSWKVRADDVLNIRERPTSSSKKIGSLKLYTDVTLTDREFGEKVYGNERWFKVGQGWVSAFFITVKGGDPSWCV